MSSRMIITVTAIAGLFVVLFALERLVQLRRPARPLLGRLLVNAVVSILALLAATFTVRPTISSYFSWTSDQPFGVLHLLPLPIGARLVLAFLLLDLTFYYWHRANHRIAFLWRFHNVHHVDPDLDVTTAFRFHFGELAMSAAFRVVQLVLIGPPALAYVVYETAFQANTLFHHSNVRLPIGLERGINKVLVTPRMHGIHHSQIEEETNSNYSVVFSWWDRLHRTLRLDVAQSAIAIGIPGYSSPEDNRPLRVLTMPFERQREYFRRPDGTGPGRVRDAQGADPRRLAE